MKKETWLAICGLFTFLCFMTMNNAVKAASNAELFNDELTDYFYRCGNDGDEDYYHEHFDEKSGILKVNIKLPDREEIYGGNLYFIAAIKAAKKAKFHRNLTQICIKDDDDKYAFNIADIKGLSLKSKVILAYVEDYYPADYDDAKDQHEVTDACMMDYLSDMLLPKAVEHVSYNDE